MKAPLLPPQNSKKRNLGEKCPVLSPIFVFKNGGDTEGVNLALKTTSAGTNQFIL